MKAYLALLGLVGVLLVAILATFGLFGARIEAWLDAVLSQPGSSLVVGGVVFGALALDVVLPLPSSLLSAVSVVWLGPIWGAGVIWSGMTLGHLIGYGLGARYGAPVVRQVAGAEAEARLAALGPGLGMGAIVALTRAVPVLSEAAAVVAGAAGMGWRRFGTIAAAANLGVALVYGALVAATGDNAPFLLIFAASIVVPALGFGVLRLFIAREG